ncbi:MAG TPA: hypothetical protein VMR73_01390 [Candidatus Paceibacterota bacterium]|nr:hypothetical protein [Candidatus Paceibacterota bacterium]
MNTLIIIRTAFLLLIAFAGIVYVLALMGLETWIFFVWTGEIKQTVRGQRVHRVVPNVPGYRYNDVTKKMVKLQPGEKPEKLPFYTRWFGFYLNPFYPFEKPYKYKFECDVIETVMENGKAVEKIRHAVYENVSSLYWKFIYAVESMDVELEGNITIRVLVQVTYQVVNPIHLIFILDGKWAERAKEAVQGLIIGYSRDKEFNRFRAEATQNSSDSAKPSLGQFLTGKYLLSTEEIEPGKDITNPGIIIVEARLIEFGYSGKSAEIQKALTEKAVAEQDALAQSARAKGAASEITQLADANAHRIIVEGDAAAHALKVQREAAGSEEAFVRMLEARATENTNVTVLGATALPTYQVEKRNGGGNQ